MPKSRRKAFAVVIPWMAGDVVTEVKFRFPEGTADNGDRFTSKAGGKQTLFGLQHLGAHHHTLLLCEGEVNAMSIWQALHDSGRADRVDVVSFGAESGVKSGLVARLAGRYQRVIVWADQARITRDALAVLGGRAHGLKSPAGKDANDLLQAGKLADFIAAVLERFKAWRSVTLVWPAVSRVGVVEGKWTRLDSGEIEATYTPDELAAALWVARAGKAAA